MTFPSPESFESPESEIDNSFSFRDGMAVIALVAVISAMIISVASSVAMRNTSEKLRSDVKNLNEAVNVYRANGGDLSGFTDPEHVLLKLKSQIEFKTGLAFDGLTSTVIDPRVQISYLTRTDTESDRIRAYWDAASQRFVLAKSGAEGIKRFYLDGEQNTYRHESSATMATVTLPKGDSFFLTSEKSTKSGEDNNANIENGITGENSSKTSTLRTAEFTQENLTPAVE